MSAVEVCAICDIAGCHHIRERAAKPTDTQTRDRALTLALRLRKAGCHDEAQRLRAAVKTAEQQELMQEIGRAILERMVEDAEQQIVVLEGRG